MISTIMTGNEKSTTQSGGETKSPEHIAGTTKKQEENVVGPTEKQEGIAVGTTEKQESTESVVVSRNTLEA